MVSIPTPIPEHLVRMGDWLRNGPWLLRLYRLLLLVAISALVIAALASGTVLLAAIAGIVVSVYLTDDIRQTVNDLWNLNFWVFKA